MQLTPSGEMLRRRILSLHPLLLLVTHEEQRGIGLVSTVVREHSEDINSVMVWTLGVGWEEAWNRNPRHQLVSVEIRELNPNRAFDLMRAKRSLEEGTLFILKDFTQFLNGPQNYLTTRVLRDTVALFRDVGDNEGPAIIVMLDSQAEIPDRLEKLVHVVDLELPDREHLRAEFAPLIADRMRTNRLAVLTGQPDPEGVHTLDALVESSLGLTLTEAESAIGMSLAATEGIDPQIIINEKRGIIKKSGVLEFFDAQTGMNDVGGLANLKAWLELRKQAFTQEARDFGLPTPRGMLVLGSPGTGKSLTAKSIGRAWGMPVIRMDVGALFGSLVGQTEANMRKALKTASAVAPCILFVDEIEKAFGGMNSGGGDGGTSTRSFGTFLSWMNDHTEPVFVMATANSVSRLPPELLRAGRFDALFYVDLPTTSERCEILSVVLRKFKRPPDLLDQQAIADVTAGFSGAELESVVAGALFRAYHAGRELETADCLEEARHITPVSVTMEEQITELREWAETRTQKAGTVEVEAEAEQSARVQLQARPAVQRFEPRRALASIGARGQKKPTIN